MDSGPRFVSSQFAMRVMDAEYGWFGDDAITGSAPCSSSVLRVASSEGRAFAADAGNSSIDTSAAKRAKGNAMSPVEAQTSTVSP